MKINKRILKLRDTRGIIRAEKNEMQDRKCQEINTYRYIGGGKCAEAWKFIKNIRTSEKESVHLQMIPIDRWVQYYQDLHTENRPEFEGNKNISPTQMDGEIVEVSEERVRKAMRELKMGNHADQKEYKLKC